MSPFPISAGRLTCLIPCKEPQLLSGGVILVCASLKFLIEITFQGTLGRILTANRGLWPSWIQNQCWVNTSPFFTPELSQSMQASVVKRRTDSVCLASAHVSVSGGSGQPLYSWEHHQYWDTLTCVNHWGSPGLFLWKQFHGLKLSSHSQQCE